MNERQRKLIEAHLNGDITPKQWRKALKADPELREFWDNRMKRIAPIPGKEGGDDR